MAIAKLAFAVSCLMAVGSAAVAADYGGYYSLNITELSDTQLSVQGTFPGNLLITNPTFDASDDAWSLVPNYNGGLGVSALGSDGSYISSISWVDPYAPSNFNVFSISYGLGGLETVAVYRDLSPAGYENEILSGQISAAGCYPGPCPVLANGATYTGVPLHIFDADGGGYGTLDVTFTDRSAAPEPATWAMLMVGVLGVGGILRGKRLAARKARGCRAQAPS